VASRKGRWGILFREGDYFFSVNNQKDMKEEGRSEEKSWDAVYSKQ
jgi:hypothetical protein